MPPKFTLGVPKNTFPPVADPLAVVFNPYVNVVLLVALTEKTPFKLAVTLPLVIVGTPVISTVVGIPGTMPVSVALAVTVTTPDDSVAEVMPNDVEGCVTSTPRITPEPPGVTYAKWPCGAMAICGYWPVFSVTCE